MIHVVQGHPFYRSKLLCFTLTLLKKPATVVLSWEEKTTLASARSVFQKKRMSLSYPLLLNVIQWAENCFAGSACKPNKKWTRNKWFAGSCFIRYRGRSVSLRWSPSCFCSRRIGGVSRATGIG